MNRIHYFIPLLVSVLFACSSSSNNSENAFKDISIEEYSMFLQNSPRPQIVDVRTAEEVGTGRIEGSINLDFKSPDFASRIEQISKNETVLIYCASGIRSGRAMELMKEKGFKEIYNLEGGLNAWREAGMPIVK
jgi:rhodanese-related sulfurtransferase